MFWILQLGLEDGGAEEAMLEAIEDFGLPHTCIKVVPFSHELIPEPEVTEDKVVVYGGVDLKKIVQGRDWNPGIYLNENFVFEAWLENWGEHLLNHDSTICRFDEVPLQIDRFFIRPCATNKAFSGCHIDWDDYEEWREEILGGEVSQHYKDLTADTRVAVAPYRADNIYKECRFFVVDGRIVAGSFYRSMFWNKYIEFFDTPWYDPDMHGFVQERVGEWQPDKAFVLDIAQTTWGYRIIEVNCLNSSGLYECDPVRIVQALEEMEA